MSGKVWAYTQGNMTQAHAFTDGLNALCNKRTRPATFVRTASDLKVREDLPSYVKLCPRCEAKL